MKEEKIQVGKSYDTLTDEERARIIGFTPQEHAELKHRFGNRLRHVTVEVDEDERYDYLLVRPGKDILLAMAGHKDDVGAANEMLIKNCVKAGCMEALDDSAVYTSVISAIAQLISGQAAFMRKA